MKHGLLAISLLNISFYSQTALAKNFSLYTFPSLSFEHGGRSLGAEVYPTDDISVGGVWAQNAENHGVEMDQKFFSTDLGYWTGTGEQWNRWRFGVALGYHWLHPEKDVPDGRFIKTVYANKEERVSVGFSLGWRATAFDTFYIEPALTYLSFFKCVKDTVYCKNGSGLLGVKIGFQL